MLADSNEGCSPVPDHHPPVSRPSPPAWRPPGSSPLLALPTELQLAIYEMVLNYPQTLSINHLSGNILRDFHDTTELTPQHYALTQVCSFVRDLTSPIFYSRNRFSAELVLDWGLEPMVKWLGGLGVQKRLWVGSLSFFHEGLAWQLVEYRLLREIFRSPIVRDMYGKLLHKPVIHILEHGWLETGFARHELVFAIDPVEDGRPDWTDALETLFMPTSPSG